MRKYLPAIVVVAVIAAVIVGVAVGRDNKKTTTSTSPATPPASSSSSNSSSSSTSSQPASATDQVSIDNFAFSPAKLTVKMGTKVTWTNNDSAAHTVTVDSGSGPNSSSISPGSTYSFTFDTAGTFAYHCSIHPSMTGSVIVTQ